MDVKGIIAGYKEKIDKELESFLDCEVKYGRFVSKSVLGMANEVREFNLRGGKRLRPVLMIHGYKCLKRGSEEEIIKASLSIELLEGYLLIHDDVMDEDEVRRGKPSTWKLFEETHRKNAWTGNSRKFGETAAIIAGDISCSLATEAVINTRFPPEAKLRAIELLDRININTGYGQMLDVLSEVKPDVSEGEIMLVHEYKTSKYTVEGPLHMGAVLGGAGKKELSTLTKYGIPLGKAFQIQDDILGMFGDEKKLGKPADSDLKEGKKTTLILEALKKCAEKEKKKVMSALGNRDVKKEDVEEVREIIRACGSLDYSKRLAETLAEKARKEIEKSSFREEGKEFLVGMADFIIHREY